MKSNNDYIWFDEQVERYLHGQLTTDEERAFKQLLIENQDLKDRARITALMIREMRHVMEEESSESQKIVQTIKGMSEEQFRKAAGLPQKDRIISLWPQVMKYVAVACLVGAITMIGFQQYDASQYKAIGNDISYLAYVPMLSETGHDRGAGETEAISKKNEILILFHEIEHGNNLKENVEILQVYYDQMQFENSSSALSVYQDDFAWYLSIGYLKLGKGKKAIPLLESIIQRGEPANVELANGLLKRIKRV